MESPLSSSQSRSQGTAKEFIESLPPAIRARIATNVLFPPDVTIRWPKRVIGEALLLLAQLWVRRQRPQLQKHHAADHDNVRALYDAESRRYLQTHAATTSRQDDAWRLWLAQAVVTEIREVNAQQRRPALHLDLFAGSGLSYQSQAQVFHLHDVAVNTVLVDASAGMLDVAARSTIPRIEQRKYATFLAPELTEAGKRAAREAHRRTVEIIQADPDGDGSVPMPSGPNGPRPLAGDSVDIVSIMFGLGAISLAKAMSLSHSLLRILKEHGRFATIDMHKPVAALAGRWAWPVPLELRSPWIEQEGYRRITVPYVLKRLWGWCDPTFHPHLMKLAVIQSDGNWYGWEEELFVLQSRRWDFGAPAMATYQQILAKVRLSEQEAAQRQQAAQAMLSCAQREGD